MVGLLSYLHGHAVLPVEGIFLGGAAAGIGDQDHDHYIIGIAGLHVGGVHLYIRLSLAVYDFVPAVVTAAAIVASVYRLDSEHGGIGNPPLGLVENGIVVDPLPGLLTVHLRITGLVCAGCRVVLVEPGSLFGDFSLGHVEH